MVSKVRFKVSAPGPKTADFRQKIADAPTYNPDFPASAGS
jgi:hypothetical protein